MPTMRTLIRIPWFVTMATSIVVLLGAHPGRLAASLQEPDIVVTTTAELQSALSPANAGAHILVRAGVYRREPGAHRTGWRDPRRRGRHER